MKHDDLSALPQEGGFRLRGVATTRTEAFTDAAFAFAVTLLVISTGSLPDTMDELLLALRRIPAFAASFAILAVFWIAHNGWSRRYGLDDATSRLLSLGLVFTVLVFVYPLRIVAASLFHAVSGGWLPAEMPLRTMQDLQDVFAIYSCGYAALASFVLLLHVHARRRADALGLDALERHDTRWIQIVWTVQLATALVALAIALLRESTSTHSVFGPGLPGFVYGTLGLSMPLCGALNRRGRARLLALRD
jgi:uncharacterized membrane protein